MDWNRRIVETSAGGLWVTDLEGRTLDANAATAGLLGVTREQLLQLGHADFLDDRGRTQFALHLDDLRAGRVNQVEVDCLFRRPDGSSVWAVLREALLRDEDGTVIGVLMNVDDITRRKELVSELQRSEGQRTAAERVARLGSWQWDPATGVIDYSHGLTELYGARTPTVFASYDSFVESVHPDDRTRVVTAVARLEHGEPAFEFEARMHAEAGWIWVYSRGVVADDGPGGSPTVVGTLVDVTRVRDTDDALRDMVKQDALMRAVATRANEAATLVEVLLDARSLVLLHDDWERARAFVPGPGGGLVEIAPQDSPDLDRPAAPGVEERELATARSCLRERRPVWDEEVRLTFSFPVVLGEEVVAVVTITSRPPLHRHDLIETMAAQVAEQLGRVADREHVAQQLADARDRALEASSQKSTFLSTMSHEIRTPLNGVLGLTELLGHTGLDERQRHLVDGLDLSGRALLEVINEVLDFSKIEAGHLELETLDVEVRAVLDQVAGVLAEPARARGLELTVSCHPDVPPLVSGDPSRLVQVLTNLVSNAVKFTSSGGVDIRATMDPPSPEGRPTLRVEVRDTGVGIAADTIGSVFQPFSQADASTTRRFGGTGLGLAICREVVQAMGGSLGVDSELGAGSTFWFTVPVDVPREAVPDDALTHLRRLVGGLRLLVVDDAASGRRVLAEQLAWFGAEAQTVTGAGAAEQVLAQGAGRLDAVLLDLTTPYAESYAVADRLEAAGRAAGYPRLPVALLTSDLPPEDAVLAEHGIDHCLTRPISSAKLRDLLLRILGPDALAPGPDGRPAGAPGTPHIAHHTVHPTVHPAALPGATPGRDRRPVPRGERLLVVEDNEVNRIVASGFLAALGLVVDTAEDGLQALEVLGSGDYDLVLMDVQMPGIDGYETTRRWRALEAARGARRTPVVAMTAAALEDERERALEAGLDDYMTKPVTGARVAAMVARWLDAEPGPDEVGDPRCLDAARLAELHDLVAGGDYLRRAVESFLARAPALLADVRDAADPASLSSAAHALRGSALNLGAWRLGQVAGDLERRGVEGGLADPAGLAELGRAVREATAALRRHHARFLATPLA